MLSDKKVIVIGGLGGIGAAICRSLLKNGVDKLAIIDIHETITEEFKDNPCISYTKCHVDKREELKNAFTKIDQTLNGINMVVNSAGIVNEVDLEKAFSVNTFGVMNSTTTAANIMRKDRNRTGGIIINVASTLGYLPYYGFPVYVATKHAVLGFIKSLAEPSFCELTGLKFITICPGYTNTSLIGSSPLHELALKVQDEPFPPQHPDVVAECLLKSLSTQGVCTFWKCVNGEISEVELLTIKDI